MPFDEELRRAIDTLTDRIRDEVARALNETAAELASQAAADRDSAANEAANDARVDAERIADARVAEVERTAEERVAMAARENSRTADLAANERLLAAITALDGASSLSEILDVLANCAGHEAARVAVLLVRGSSLRGWRFLGFDAVADAAEIELPLDGSGVIGDAVRTVATASSDSSAGLSQAPFALADGHERVAVPIPMNGQVVAVLYADQGNRGASRPPVVWPLTLDIMARHAARSLEAITAFKAARALSGSAGAEAPRHSALPTPDPQPLSEDEQAAKRYARLLISEIKLYHEPAVTAGRLGRDLAARLGGEISHARALYEQRVPTALRQRTDYFDAELVRTLADGDATLLQSSAS